MNHHRAIGFCAGALLCAAGCGKPPEAAPAAPASVAAPACAPVSGESALEEVRRFVALGNRDAGTEGAKKAAEYLFDRLRTLGVEAQIQELLATRWWELPAAELTPLLPLLMSDRIEALASAVRSARSAGA